MSPVVGFAGGEPPPVGGAPARVVVTGPPSVAALADAAAVSAVGVASDEERSHAVIVTDASAQAPRMRAFVSCAFMDACSFARVPVAELGRPSTNNVS